MAVKRFLAGPTGAGKTTFARRMAQEAGAEYVDYDNAYCPAPIMPSMPHKPKSPEEAAQFIRSLPDNCVVDNIPHDPSWSTFNRLARESPDSIEVWCAIVPFEEWISRSPGGGHRLTREIWSHFWIQKFPTLGCRIRYLDTSGEVGHTEAMDVIRFSSLVCSHVLRAPKDHDIGYQDIPEVGIVGYSGSPETWERIKPLADWAGKTVVDCGCFHGYTLFRISDLGRNSRLIGLDFLDRALVLARCVNRLRGDSVEFREWLAGEPVPKADITLCLNALHHFTESGHPIGKQPPTRCTRKQFFDSIQSPVAIFEAYRDATEDLMDYWPNVNVVDSARPNRAIFRCSK